MDVTRPAALDPREIWEQLWVGFKPVSSAWDVGANAGQTVGQLLTFSDRVLAFEPCDESRALLMQFLDYHKLYDKLMVRGVALTDKDAEIELLDMPSQMATGQLVSKNTDLEWALNPATPRKVIGHRADTLVYDRGWAPPGFLKVDTEGHEIKVLNGAHRIIAEHRPELLVEVHSEVAGDLIAKAFTARGYRVEAVRHPYYEKDSVLWRGHYWLRLLTSD